MHIHPLTFSHSLATQLLLRSERKRNKDIPLGNRCVETHYLVPPSDWDLTPAEKKPLSFYITDSHIAAIITTIYDKDELEGDWHKFARLEEADCFFHPPYRAAALDFGFSNDFSNETSSRGVCALDDGKVRAMAVAQGFNVEDVLVREPDEDSDTQDLETGTV